MPAALYNHCQVHMSTSVYVMGGMGSSSYSSSVFFLQDLMWREVSPMLAPRQVPAFIAPDMKIYAIGGADRFVLSKDEIYDPLSDRWQQGPALPVTLYEAQVIEHQDNIYVVGEYVTYNSQPNTKVFTLSGGEGQVVAGVFVQGGERRVFPAPVLSRAVLFCH